MNKTCNRCNQDKPILDFYKNNKMLDGRVHQCIKCVLESKKIFYENNRDELYLKRKEFYWNNREESLKKSSEWAKKNKDKRKIIRDRWTAKNKFAKSIMNKNWNAKKLGAVGSFSVEEYKNKLAKYDNKCGYCMSAEPYTVDHIVPISKGGTNYITNIIPACLRCNGQKRDYLLSEWLKLPNCYNKNKHLIA